MKIRIKDNSIRLRLTQSEVDEIKTQNRVRSATAFPGGRQFGYSIEADAKTTSPGASLSENAITVHLPLAVAEKWASTEQVSVTGEQTLDDGDTLILLIEKDFACLAPRPGEDETDMYPHPSVDSENC